MKMTDTHTTADVVFRFSRDFLLIMVVGLVGCTSGGDGGPASTFGGYVLLTEWYGGLVAKIDPATDQIVSRTAVGTSPQFIVADQARRLAYVSLLDDDKVVAIKTDTMETADLTVAGLGRQPIGLALASDGRTLLVATRGTDGEISSDDRLDVVTLDHAAWPPAASLRTSIFTGKHPITAVIDHTGRYAVVTVRNEPAILVVDLSTFETVTSIQGLPADAEPEGVDAHPSENVMYVTLHGVSTIEVIDLDDLSANTKHVPILNSTVYPSQPSTVKFTPDGRRAYIQAQTANRVLLFDTSDPRYPVQDPGVELAVGNQPHFLVLLPGDRAYVANTNNYQLNGSLSVIENYSGTPSVSEPILPDLQGPLSFVYMAGT